MHWFTKKDTYGSKGIAILTALATLTMTTISLAGGALQGGSLQGGALQGGALQGGALQGAEAQATWLQGDRLIGALGQGNSTSIVEVHGFAGDVVEMSDWIGGAGAVRQVPPQTLRGMQWSEENCFGDDCMSITYRIADVQQDTSQNTMPAHGDNSDVWLYEVEFATSEDPGAGDWLNACGAEGSTGIFVNGRWAQDGSFSPNGYTFSCHDGVVSKCARSWGYKPWKTLVANSGEAVDLQTLHVICTRAARADYCGDGVPYTRNGTFVDMFDIYGFNVRENYAGFTMESAFHQGGAAWVERTRWPVGEVVEQDSIDLPTCSVARYESSPGAETARIYVWSDPGNGQ